MEPISIQKGVEAYRAGDKLRARIIFIELLKQDPRSEAGWAWLAACVEETGVRKYCFEMVLAINPGNAGIRKALRALQPEAAPEPQPVPAPVVVQEPEKTAEDYLAACKTALGERKYAEALQSANRALEIDPGRSQAWLDKAVATFWLTTEAENRYAEAMGYVDTAEKIDRDNPLIQSTRKRLREGQCGWYTHLGDEADAQAGKITEEAAAGEGQASDPVEAKRRLREYVLKAMNYYLLASQYDPDDLTPLYKIKYLVEYGNWIAWPAEVRIRIASLERKEEANRAKEYLAGLQKQFEQTQAKLAELKKEKGLTTGVKTLRVKVKMATLQRKIERQERGPI